MTGFICAAWEVFSKYSIMRKFLWYNRAALKKAHLAWDGQKRP